MADEGALYRIELDIKDLKRQAQEVTDTIHGIGRKAEEEGSRMDGVFKKINGYIAGYFSAKQALSFAQSIVQVRSEIEGLEVSFKTLLGSEEKASQLFGEIRQFAVNTPMMMNDLSKGAQTLLAFNYDADKVMPTLRALGDISMGDSQKFNSLTLAFAQMSSAGKLMGQDLMQMINAGFNPLAEISAKTGKSIGELKDEMAKGAISSQMVEEAFISATSEGGKFFGMLEAQSKTMAGALSNLQGAWEDMLNAIGEDAQGVFTDVVSDLTYIVKHYEDLGRVIAELISIYGVYKVAVMATTVAQGAAAMATKGYTTAEIVQYGWLVLCEKAHALLNKTILKNPYALAAAALAAMAVAIYEVYKKSHELSVSEQAIADATAEMNKEIVSEKKEINGLFDTLKKAKKGTEEYDNAKSAILNKYGKYLEGLSEEIKSLNDVEGAYRAITKAAMESAKARAAAKAQEGSYDRAAESEGNARVEIEKLIRTKYKGDTGDMVWKKVEQFLDSKEFDNPTIKDGFINKLRKKFYEASSFGGSGTWKLDELFQDIKNSRYKLDQELKEIETKFGKPAETTETATETPTTATETTEDDKKDNSKEIARLKEEARKRREAIDQFGKDNAKAAYMAALDAKEAEIQGWEDGFAKEMAMIDIQYKRLEAENSNRRDEMLEDLRDTKEAEFLNANPTKTANDFNRESVKEKDFTEDQKKIVESYTNIANKQKVDAERNALNKMLQEYETYEQKRNRIAAQYERERLAMYDTDGEGNSKLREGVTQGNVDELSRQRDDALSAVDEEFASRSDEYQAWLDTVGGMTLEKLQEALQKAQEELDKLKGTEGADMNKVAVGMTKVKKLQDQIKKTQAKKDLGAPDKTAAEKWNELNGVVQESAGVFKALGEAIGGTVGEIFNNLGDITSMTGQMISGIVSLVETSSGAMNTTAAVGAASMSAMEKASVILTVISMAIQLATLIAQSIDPDKANKARIEALKAEIEDLEWQLNHMDIVRTSERIGDAYEYLVSGMSDYYQGISDQIRSGEIAYIEGLKKMQSEEERMAKVTDLVRQRMDELNYSTDKAYGQERYKDIERQGDNMVQQIAKNYEIIKREKSNKKPDEDTISEAEENIRTLQQDLQDLYNDMLEDILGGSAESIADQLGSAFIDAFAEGTDAAQAWGEEVNDIVADIMKQMIIQNFLEDRIAAIFDKYKQSWFDGDEMDIDEVINSMGDFKDDLDTVGEEFSQVFDMLPEDVKNMLTANASAREAASKGIATASQESVDELNGRMTAVQGHTYSISENTKLVVSMTTQILNHLMNIESHASHISGKVDTIEHNVQIMRNELDRIDLQGVKIQ